MANRDTLFISTEYIKTKTSVDPNVDAGYIKNAIWEAQRFNLMQIIGSGLYDEIESQLDAGTLTAANQTLLHKYIAPCLKYWVLINLMPQILVKITNKGIVSKNSDNSTSADYSLMNKMMTDATDKAQYLAKELKDFLNENSSTYTLYLNPGSTADTIYPNTEVFESGIFTGNTHINVPFGYKMDNPLTYGCDEE